jgi:hypothetical protein
VFKKTALLGVMETRACGRGKKVACSAFKILKKTIGALSMDLTFVQINESFFSRHAYFSL